MTVSLEEYRIRIGVFNVNNGNNQRKFRNLATKPTGFYSVIFLLALLSTQPGAKTIVRDSTDINIQVNCIEIKPVFSTRLYDSRMDLNLNPTCGSMNWSYTVASNNSLNHSLLGNRQRLGYKLAFWNCRKGLIDNLTHDTDKAIDIRRFIDKHQPHVFGVIETNLHSANSRVYRRTPVTKRQIEERLNIEGYNIELPDTWDNYGQARVYGCWYM